MSTLTALADRLDPTPVDVFDVLDYEPTERQHEFHDATEFDVGYGGAAGGGKTRALLMHGIRACIEYPGIKVAAFRRSFPELESSLLEELAHIGYAAALGASYNTSKHDLTFRNGSKIRFRYAETVADATRQQGSEIQLLLVDERTQVPAAVIEYLATRLRSSDPNIPVLGIRSGTNPGGVGHGAFKTEFITATDHGNTVVVDGKGRTRRFIPAKVTDNPHINPEYEADLAGIKDPALRAALKDGNWDTFAGQFFTEWNRDRHVVPAFSLPESWRRVAGLDWGWAAPHAVLWAAVDANRRVFVYRELYDTQTPEKELARRILDAEGALTDDQRLRRLPPEKVQRVADPAMWGKTSDAHPVAVSLIGAGVLLVPAENDRVSGWQRVHTYLADGPACEVHRELGWETCPLLHVLDGAAPNLVRTLPELIHDDKRVEDVDTKGEDHAPDALRYLLMFLPVPGHKREAKQEPSTTVERLEAAREARAKKRKQHPILGTY